LAKARLQILSQQQALLEQGLLLFYLNADKIKLGREQVLTKVLELGLNPPGPLNLMF